jgi:hypothetical protein
VPQQRVEQQVVAAVACLRHGGGGDCPCWFIQTFVKPHTPAGDNTQLNENWACVYKGGAFAGLGWACVKPPTPAARTVQQTLAGCVRLET